MARPIHKRRPFDQRRGKPAPAPTRGAHRREPARELLAEDVADDALDLEHAATETGPTLVRLNKYLADHGIASRRRCDELIEAGKVSVDGEPTRELGLRIDPQRQAVEIDGFVLKPETTRKRYYLLNKPAGVVCTNEVRETRPRAIDLITDRNKGRIYTVGRLDEESKGLILLTNDGEFANRVMHPRFGVEKTYVVKVAGKVEDEALQKIREGVHLSEGRTAGMRVLVTKRLRDTSTLTLTLREGINREIRRVFARVGYKVLDLRRTRIGPLTERGIKIGKWRELLRSEVEMLATGHNEQPVTPPGKRGKLPRRPPVRSGRRALQQRPPPQRMRGNDTRHDARPDARGKQREPHGARNDKRNGPRNAARQPSRNDSRAQHGFGVMRGRSAHRPRREH